MQTVQVINVSKDVIIAQEAWLAQSMDQRMRGLLGRESLGANEALILKPCSSIHTFFMRFAIDVLFLDKNMHVVKAVQNIPPNRLTPIIWKSHLAIELPAGKISQTNTSENDKIELK